MRRPAKPPPKRKAANAAAPETEVDFLQAADEEEQGGNKWKAGDVVKALRFFQRAIDYYNQGLKKFPQSFDLAYNKAVLQYEMTQDSRISRQMGNPQALLEETLQSHRYALSLEPSNADVQFNTAQVLTSCAELLGDRDDYALKMQAFVLLEQAIELFTSCLSRQEVEFSEAQAQIEQTESGLNDETVPASQEGQTSPPPSEGSGEWATILEPVTAQTLIENGLATLSALTSMLKICTEVAAMYDKVKAILTIAEPLIQAKLPSYIALLPETVEEDPDARPSGSFLSLSSTDLQTENQYRAQHPRSASACDLTLAQALFQSTLAESEYRRGMSDAQQYLSRVTGSFDTSPNSPIINLSSQVAYAEAISDFSAAVRDHFADGSADKPILLCWQALTKSQDILASVIKLYDSKDGAFWSVAPISKGRIYLLRGDTELLRLRLTKDSLLPANLQKSASVLMKNAGVYYRGANILSTQSGDHDSAAEARVKAAIVQVFAEGSAALPQARPILSGGHTERILLNMVDEDLITTEEVFSIERMLRGEAG